MDKKNKLSNNNKGVALITIVIAVAFISIVSSALMYITFMNYQMKVLNLNSKKNFYETDGELVKITAGIRNNIENPDDFDKLLLVEDAKFDEKTGRADSSLVRLEGKDGILDWAGLWNNDENKVIEHDNEDTFIYSVGDVTKTVDDEGITTYVIENLKVNQISKKDSYSNSVQTNLRIRVKEQNGGSTSTGGLGNCSVLVDSNIEISAGEFAFVSFLGNAYCASYGDKTEKYTIIGTDGNTTSENVYTIPNVFAKKTETFTYQDWSRWPDHNITVTRATKEGSALYLKDHTKMNVEGDNLVVYGDVVLTGSSCLNITTGNLKVFGDIYLLDNSTIICGGEIYLPDFWLPGRSDYCSIRSDVSGTKASDAYLKEHLYCQKSIKKITGQQYAEFAHTLNLDGPETSDDGIVNKIAKDVKINKEEHPIFDTTNVKKTIPGDYYGVKCGVAVMMPGDVGNLGAYTNYLVFLTDSGEPDTNHFNMNATNTHSTFVSRASLYLNTQNGIYYTKMGPEIFDYLMISDKNSKFYDAPSGSEDTVHNFSVTFDNPGTAGDGTVDNLSVSKLLDSNTNTYINDLFGVGSSDSSDKNYINSATFFNYKKDAD